MSAVKYWLWLSCLEKPGKRKLHSALRWFGDPEAIYKADEKALKFVDGLTDGDISFLMNKELDKADEIIRSCQEKGISVVTMQDAAYPALLKNIEDPPFVLYVLGALPDLGGELPIAVVGSRKCSAYGQLAAKRLGYQLSRCGATVVSGMAEGIDGMAHQGALLAGSRTVAVLGGGVDVVYPKAHKKLYEDIIQNGAVISEYPPGTPTLADHFPVRNRIISGICYGVVVVECAKKSGALITARNALEQGRDVYAVPGNIDNYSCSGSNQLIKEGAGLVTKGWDVVSEYAHLRPDKAVYKADAVEIRLDSVRPRPQAEEAAADTLKKDKLKPESDPKSKPSDKKVIDKEDLLAYIQRIEALGPDEKAVVEAIGDKTRHVDDIIDLTQLKAARVLAALTLLEIQGIVKQSTGKRYTLCK